MCSAGFVTTVDFSKKLVKSEHGCQSEKLPQTSCCNGDRVSVVPTSQRQDPKKGIGGIKAHMLAYMCQTVLNQLPVKSNPPFFTY